MPPRSKLHLWAPECPNVRNLKCRLDLDDIEYSNLTPLYFKGLKEGIAHRLYSGRYYSVSARPTRLCIE